MRRQPRLALVFALLACVALSAVVLTGCGPKGPVWVESGGTYTTATLTPLYANADISKLAAVPSTEADKMRHDALIGLRARGGAAAAAADLITKTLPSGARAGVPVYVEKATVGGQPALVIVEAIGPAQGKLTTRRLWAISQSGVVLFVGTH